MLISKYKVGDIFIRNYDNMDHECVMMSCDYDYRLKQYVWHGTMLPIFSDRQLKGGGTSIFSEEDLDGMTHIGNVSQLLPDK